MTETKDFVIKDKRGQEDTAADDQPTASGPAPEPPPMPKIDFATFIFSLNSAVLVNLGLIEDPAAGKKEKNLPLAKQTIDLIALMEEKTKGNLTAEEDNLLKHVLYELRILYVKEKG
jgi:hypothetical protein